MASLLSFTYTMLHLSEGEKQKPVYGFWLESNWAIRKLPVMDDSLRCVADDEPLKAVR
jgi:hypothetical protein